MKIEEYEKITDETAVYPKQVDDFSLAYLYLGLAGEVKEFDDKLYSDVSIIVDDIDVSDLIDEFGDIIWYTTSLCKLLGIDVSFIEEVYNSEEFISIDEDSHVINLCQDIKKYYRDKKPIDVDKVKKIISNLIAEGKDSLSYHNNGTPVDLDIILLRNFTKLSSRKLQNKIQGDGDRR